MRDHVELRTRLHSNLYSTFGAAAILTFKEALQKWNFPALNGPTTIALQKWIFPALKRPTTIEDVKTTLNDDKLLSNIGEAAILLLQKFVERKMMNEAVPLLESLTVKPLYYTWQLTLDGHGTYTGTTTPFAFHSEIATYMMGLRQLAAEGMMADDFEFERHLKMAQEDMDVTIDIHEGMWTCKAGTVWVNNDGEWSISYSFAFGDGEIPVTGRAHGLPKYDFKEDEDIKEAIDLLIALRMSRDTRGGFAIYMYYLHLYITRMAGLNVNFVEHTWQTKNRTGTTEPFSVDTTPRWIVEAGTAKLHDITYRATLLRTGDFGPHTVVLIGETHGLGNCGSSAQSYVTAYKALFEHNDRKDQRSIDFFFESKKGLIPYVTDDSGDIWLDRLSREMLPCIAEVKRCVYEHTRVHWSDPDDLRGWLRNVDRLAYHYIEIYADLIEQRDSTTPTTPTKQMIQFENEWKGVYPDVAEKLKDATQLKKIILENEFIRKEGERCGIPSWETQVTTWCDKLLADLGREWKWDEFPALYIFKMSRIKMDVYALLRMFRTDKRIQDIVIFHAAGSHVARMRYMLTTLGYDCHNEEDAFNGCMEIDLISYVLGPDSAAPAAAASRSLCSHS